MNKLAKVGCSQKADLCPIFVYKSEYYLINSITYKFAYFSQFENAREYRKDLYKNIKIVYI